MAMSKQILNKIQRNLSQFGIAATRDASNNVVAAGMTISYVDAQIQGPMGGIDGSTSPFLGIGVGNPGQISIDTNPSTLAQYQVLAICAAFANSIAIPAGLLPGAVDWLSLGQ
jgi:hypothetical protein